MTPMTLSDIAAAVGADAASLPDLTARRVSTDTRTLRPGDLFVALRGERFDAHDHLADAAHAAAAIVERVPADAPAGLPLIVVRDSRRALGDLAAAHRRTLGTVIAIAGSNGKTGTKLLVHAALRRARLGTASPKSFNNDIGVPLTLLAADPVDDYVVVECGTNHRGEIKRLAEIARPDIAVITSIGHEHLEGLGDLDGVRRENLDVALHGRPRLFVNGDDADLVAMARDRSLDFTTFGFGDDNDLRATDVRVSAAQTRFACDGRAWTVPHLGRHAASNALAAIAIGRAMNVDDDAIARGLADADVPPMRLNVRPLASGATLLDDSYNANPQSMEAALALLAALPCEGRRIAVLGDMLELGDGAAKHHRAAVAIARRVANVVVAVGPSMTGAAGSGHHDATAAADAVASLVRPGDLVLLKASRGTRLDRVAERLLATDALASAA